MEFLTGLSHWLTGGDRQYMRLYGCMKGDTTWIAITVGLDFIIAAGYVIIALHWWKNQRSLPDVPAKRALSRMRNIFIFCGLCGYIFIPVKMVWPAWRLYDVFMCVLGYYTWRYALNTRELKVIYGEIGRSTRLAADLAESQRQTQEKSFFLNAISHDLRTPLNGLMLQASLAEVGLESNDPDVLRQAIKEIKGSANSAARMLDNLLNYAHMESTEDQDTTERLRLSELVASVLEQHRTGAGRKGLSLSSQIPPDLLVCCNRGKLERILNNLVDNGIKYTKQGGVRLEADTNGKGIELHVIDTGIGIAQEHCEHLFKEFYQIGNEARDHSKGYGLGLAIARRLAGQLGGDLAVESALGRGSRFTVSIPACVVPAEREESIGAPALAVGS
ncbi:MAG TPA: HAMP domain-containing sensor histidine kinase [Tepidisphaeraceae bacterium]|jgi:signal transduction histidine kinase